MAGDRSTALAHYEQLKRVLETELGSKPSRDTVHLATRIRERVVRGGWATHGTLREGKPLLFHDPPFVGRTIELSALSAEWHRVAAGESRTVAIVGAAGIGKTRLADEFLKSLELTDVSVFRSRCYEAEQSLPYGPVAEALRQGIPAYDLSEIDPFWLAELARIIPEVRERHRKLPEPAQLDAEGGRRRLYEGIAQVLSIVCENRPVILLVDDLHWADDSSLALLHYLQRRVTSGLYLLTAHRPEELGTRVSSVTPELLSGRKPKVRIIHLRVLDSKESFDLLSSLIGPAESSTAFSSVSEMSAGNPFFAIELARNLAQEEPKNDCVRPSVPDSIRALFNRRFATLNDRTMALMQQAAILGSRSSYETLTAASGVPLLEVDGMIRQLARAGIITEKNGLVSFRHDLIREVAVAQIQPALTKALHLKAARALEVTRGDPGEIAVHLSLAEDHQNAFSYALRAAGAAEELFALQEAADLMQLAIQHAPHKREQIELAGRLGKLFLQMREYARARPLLLTRLENACKSANQCEIGFFESRHDLILVDAYSSALTLKESGDALKALHSELAESTLDAPTLEADILRSLLWAAARAFRPSLVEETIHRIRILHGRTTEPRAKTTTARSLGIYAAYKGALTEARVLLEQALSYAGASQDQAALVDSYVGLSTLLHRVPDIDLADHILGVALPLAEHIADPAQVANLLCNCAVCFMYLRDADSAEELLSRAKHVLDSTGHHPDTLPSVIFDLGFVAYLRGDYTAARTLWTTSLDSGRMHGVLPVVLESLASLGILALKSGEVAEARRFAAQAAKLARRGRFLLDQRSNFEELLARIRYRSGRTEKALSGLTHAAARAEATDIPLYLTVQVTRLDILIKEGRTSDVQRIRAQVRDVARRYRAPSWIKEIEKVCAEALDEGTAQL
jgi:tetratricopeptide (TPR) repeat protein